MQHLLDHARSSPNQVAQQRDHLDQLERLLDHPRVALAHRAHADEFLPL
jgi:hypothetical protein